MQGIWKATQCCLSVFCGRGPAARVTLPLLCWGWRGGSKWHSINHTYITMTWGTGVSCEWTAQDQGASIRTESDFSCQAWLESSAGLSPARLLSQSLGSWVAQTIFRVQLSPGKRLNPVPMSSWVEIWASTPAWLWKLSFKLPFLAGKNSMQIL